MFQNIPILNLSFHLVLGVALSLALYINKNILTCWNRACAPFEHLHQKFYVNNSKITLVLKQASVSWELDSNVDESKPL